MPKQETAKSILLSLVIAVLLSAPVLLLGQDAANAPPQAPTEPPAATLENTIEAGSDEAQPTRSLVNWNEYNGPNFTIRGGFGFLYEYGAFAQDDESKEQVSLQPDEKLRDFRFLLKGSLPKFERKITWQAGIMYDAPTHSWVMRQTGVMIAVPELWGSLFIGRTKEGFSQIKVMVGYDLWTMERASISDATVPILADGFKWLGYSPKHKFLWNLGYFNDLLSHNQSFSTSSSQVVGRGGWLPVLSDTDGTLFHLGINLKFAKPEDNKVRLRARPEAFTAPYFVETPQFEATATRMAGPEIYYRRKSWLYGSEYWFEKVSSESKGNPTFHGGEVFAVWLATGETRGYNTAGGFFKAVTPARPVFQGGPGAWELV